MDDVDDKSTFLASLPKFASQCYAQQGTHDLNRAEYLLQEIENHSSVINVLLETFQNTDNDAYNLCLSLLNHFLTLRNDFQERVTTLQGCVPLPQDQTGFHLFKAARLSQNSPGRPTVYISPEHVLTLRELGFNWKSISNIMGISPSTLYKRRKTVAFQEYNLEFSDISEEQLDAEVTSIMALTDRSGETLIYGSLRARGIRVQRWKIRASLQRIDPFGRALRRRRITHRRIYNVPHPNYIWHIDGNHKLIDPWGFVIHGGIDGYSRLCVFLHCSTSNRAAVVLDLFTHAVNTYGCPEHVRSDYGTENIEVARYMVRAKGLNRGSILTGLSTHNQRIERLWRDVRSVTVIFTDLFSIMENEGIADRYNPIHVMAMRYVFCPRINRALQEFEAQWNNHSMRTAKYKSPLMMWRRGMFGRVSTIPAVQYDPDDFVPDIQTENDVQVPDVTLDVSEADLQRLHATHDPLADDGDHGKTIFQQVVTFFTALAM